MNTHAINSSDGKVRGTARGNAFCCGMGRRAPIDHHQFQPGQPPSSLTTGGRSRRSGCAVRRQTGARASTRVLHSDPAILSTRHFHSDAGRATTPALAVRHLCQGLPAFAQHSRALSRFQDFPERSHDHSNTSVSVASNNAAMEFPSARTAFPRA